MKINRFTLFLTFVIFLILKVSCDDLESSKLVHVSLLSNWGFTPLHYESAEFINKQNNELFWKFIDNFSNNFEPSNGQEKELSDSKSYDLILKSSKEILDSNSYEFLKLNLAQRTFSPKVEVFRQLSISEFKLKSGSSSVSSNDWFDINGKLIKEIQEIESFTAEVDLESQILYDFDHIYGGKDNLNQNIKTVIFYGDISKSEFKDSHELLKKLSKDGKINYVLRFRIPETDRKLNLQGYGFELALKNLEYKVMDDSSIKKDSSGQLTNNQQISIPNEDISGFNFYTLSNRKPELLQKLSTFRSYLLAHSQEFDELKVWELKDLGIQTTQKVIASSDPLRSLKYISQHFPTLANNLARVSVNETLKSQMESNQKLFPDKENIVLINGRVINTETISTITLTDILQEELAPLSVIQENFNISSLNIGKLTELASSDKPYIRYNILPKNPDAIINLNNLEHQTKWTKSMEGLSKESMDENGLQISRNLMTTVIIIDPSNTDSFELMSEVFYSIQQLNTPTRISLVLMTDESTSSKKKSDAVSAKEIARLFLYLRENIGFRGSLFLFQAMNYFRKMFSPDQVSRGVISSSIQAIASQMGGNSRLMSQSLQSNAYDEIINEMNLFIRDDLMINDPQSTLPLVFLNGRILDVSRSKMDFGELLQGELFNEFNSLKDLYKAGDISENSKNLLRDILDSKLNAPLLGHLPSELFSSTENQIQYLKLLFNSKDKSKELKFKQLLNSLEYHSTTQEDKDFVYPLSHLLIGDSQNQQTRTSIVNIVNYLQSPDNSEISKNIRISFLNTGNELLKKSNFASLSELKEFFEKPINSDNVYDSDNNSEMKEYIKNYLRLNQTESKPFLIITNGRLTIPSGGVISEKTFNNLNVLELEKSKRIKDLLKEKNSNDLLIVNSLILNHIKSSVVERRSIPSSVHFSFKIEKPSSPLKFTLILNPFTKIAQKVVPIIEGFSKALGISVDVLVNPPVSVSEFPMKNYYHYVMQLEMKFDESTGDLQSSLTSGVMSNLPESRVLTLAMDIPGSWLVQPIIAKYDLDNIRLKDLGEENILTAVFELENLVVEGSCIDTVQRGPPAGLEIELKPIATRASHQIQDTIVMSNLGYYQLKSNPGIWKLSIKEGRSSEISEIIDTSLNQAIPYQIQVIDTLYLQTGNLYTKRKPGKEYEPILLVSDENDEHAPTPTASSYWSGLFSKKMKSISQKKSDLVNITNSSPDLIHIFSVASGHLYERFLKIMMLSVTKNTNSPVKFWFLKNYLSPGFKEFIPKMAEELGFQYELVTYKWPWWLRKQTEKQRIIWSYKILFLDVLFPLDVKKIIFVDADQVVRTDMKELWEMDLQGASLGLTPFCDSNKDTEGFRFWKTGYWKDHLRGKPYHISALYVVDLNKFRRISAGDHLRSTYDQLSRDANSLANLDQDLPNYLQHQVRIFSLPQEWLWCETWCDQTSKAKAKTIDLCNNPLTKTPKLQNAVRIISEWSSLDNEAKDLDLKFDKLKNQQQQKETQQKDSSSKTNNANNEQMDIILETLDEAQKDLI